MAPKLWNLLIGRRALMVRYKPYRKERSRGHQVLMPE